MLDATTPTADAQPSLPEAPTEPETRDESAPRPRRERKPKTAEQLRRDAAAKRLKSLCAEQSKLAVCGLVPAS